MSEQSPQEEKAGTDTHVPDMTSTEGVTGKESVLTDQPGREKASATATSTRFGLTQLALVVMAVVFLWQWLDGHRAITEMQQRLAKKIAEMDGNSKANQILLGQSQEQVRQLFAKVTTLEEHFAESQNQRSALENLYNDISVSRDETSLAEVEQILLTASQQMELSANVKVALIALQNADAYLQRMNRPSFNGLRKVISQDMDKLRSLPNIDVASINLQLNELVNAVEHMPLSYQQRSVDKRDAKEPAPVEGSYFKRIAHEIWLEFRQLLRIEDTGKVEIPLVPPNQEYFLRENLKLQLLSARLALLSRDEASYRMALKTARLWINRFFDVRSNDSKRMIEGLNKLATSDISIQLPEISASLKAVQGYRLSHENEQKSRNGMRQGKSRKGKSSNKGAAQ